MAITCCMPTKTRRTYMNKRCVPDTSTYSILRKLIKTLRHI